MQAYTPTNRAQRRELKKQKKQTTPINIAACDVPATQPKLQQTEKEPRLQDLETLVEKINEQSKVKAHEYSAKQLSRIQKRLDDVETVNNTCLAAKALSLELGIDTTQVNSMFESISRDLDASVENVQESVNCVATLLQEIERNGKKLIKSLRRFEKELSSDPMIISTEAIGLAKHQLDAKLSELIVQKEQAQAEANRQAEIASLLARLKELGYDPVAEAKPDEFFVTVKRHEEVVPVISITLNGEPLTMSVDEAISEVKRWRANLPKKSSKDNPLDNQDNIDHLRLIEKLSFIKQKDRTSLFIQDFDWSYNTFWYRFKRMVTKYNIKLWCRYRMTFDGR